jgi:hypothetical protein
LYAIRPQFKVLSLATTRASAIVLDHRTALQGTGLVKFEALNDAK